MLVTIIKEGSAQASAAPLEPPEYGKRCKVLRDGLKGKEDTHGITFTISQWGAVA
jgi:hypothetical protein